tara:strand:- start:1756 stop:2340 length:585 start_codon:yes stop_codon:yes gene_type:complete
MGFANNGFAVSASYPSGADSAAQAAAQQATQAANVAHAEARNARTAAQAAVQQQAAAAANVGEPTNTEEANAVRASEQIGQNAMNAPVQFNRTPSTCYPDKSLTAADLLPSEEAAEISEFNQNYPIGEGILKGINFLSSGYSIGVNTVGQSLKNANRQLRSEPPNPQVSVSPWMNTSIAPDLLRRPLEVNDSCA